MTKPTVEERLDAIERMLMRIARYVPHRRWGEAPNHRGIGEQYTGANLPYAHPLEGVQDLHANAVDAVEVALKNAKNDA